MPLDPEALITKAEQDELVALLDTSLLERRALAEAEEDLDQFLIAQAPADVGMMFDLFGDGEMKPALECVRPGGRRPEPIAAKISDQRADGARPPDAPPPAAAVDARAQARALHQTRQLAQEAYSKAGAAFNDRLNRLMRRPLCYKDECVDVFGDGLMKLVTDCTWPAPIEIYKGKMV